MKGQVIYLFLAEVETGPALPQNEAVRIVRNLPQRLEVAAVLRVVDRGGQLLGEKTSLSGSWAKRSGM